MAVPRPRPSALRAAAYFASAAVVCLVAAQLVLAAATSAEFDWRQLAATAAFVVVTAAVLYVVAARSAAAAARRADDLDALVRELPAVVYRVGRDGRIVWAGGALLAQGRPPADGYRGLPLSEVLTHRDAPRALEAFERAFGGQSAQYEYATGRRVHEFHVQPTRDGALAVGVDVTDARRAGGERELLEQRLREAERLDAIGRLAARIAHDFNNALLAIRGNAELAANASEPESRAARASEQVIDAADRAAALTRQLLAFGRRQVLSPETIDLNELVRGALPALQHLAGREYLVDFERGERAVVRVDRAELERAVANLVANARDSMPGGGRILLRTGRGDLDSTVAAAYGASPGRYGMIRVSDHGAGIDAELLEHVFEPFFTTKPTGTGLGLAAVHGVVAQSGGVVASESERGRGSTFSIYLPLAGAEATARAPLVVLPGRGAARETVLVAAADPAARDVMVAMLQEAGYDVLPARDTADALELARRNEIAVLVTDLSLPGGDGPALARAVTAERPEVGVLVVSGRIDDAADAGGYALLEKPFSAEALVEAIRRSAAGSVQAPPV